MSGQEKPCDCSGIAISGQRLDVRGLYIAKIDDMRRQDASALQPPPSDLVKYPHRSCVELLDLPRIIEERTQEVLKSVRRLMARRRDYEKDT